MGKSNMHYIKTSKKDTPFVRPRPIARTNDINKMSTGAIFLRLISRHDRIMLELALAVTWTLLIVKQI